MTGEVWGRPPGCSGEVNCRSMPSARTGPIEPLRALVRVLEAGLGPVVTDPAGTSNKTQSGCVTGYGHLRQTGGLGRLRIEILQVPSLYHMHFINLYREDQTMF